MFTATCYRTVSNDLVSGDLGVPSLRSTNMMKFYSIILGIKLNVQGWVKSFKKFEASTNKWRNSYKEKPSSIAFGIIPLQINSNEVEGQLDVALAHQFQCCYILVHKKVVYKIEICSILCIILALFSYHDSLVHHESSIMVKSKNAYNDNLKYLYLEADIRIPNQRIYKLQYYPLIFFCYRLMSLQ